MAAKTKLVFDGDNRTRRAFREINQNVSTMRRSIDGAAAGLRGFVAILATGALARAGKQSLDFADNIQKLNQRLGASTEFLSQMKFAADRTGVSFQTFTTGLQRMQRRLSEAANGSGEAQGAIRELGLDATKLVNLSLEDQFDVIAEAINGLAGDADKTRIAMKLFDTEGVALLQTMSGGADAVRGLRDEADRLGITLDQVAADKAAAANDAFTDIKTSVDGLVQSLAINMAPALVKIANFLQNDITSALRTAQAAYLLFAQAAWTALGTVLDRMAEFATTGAKALEGLFLPGSGALRQLAATFQETRDSVITFADGFGAAAGKIKTFQLEIDNVATTARNAAEPIAKILELVNRESGPGNQVLPLPPGRQVGEAYKIQGIAERATEASQPFRDAIADAMVGGIVDSGQGMKDSFRSILADLSRELVKSSLIKLLGNIAGGAGGFFGFGSKSSAQSGGQRGPGFLRVGETGPEDIFLGTRTTIRPAQFAGGGGGGMTFNIDARGSAPGAEQQIAAAVEQAVLLSRADRIETRRFRR